MRATLLTLALVCLAAPAIATDLPDGRVVELNELNFDAGVAKGPTLVEVYADWCSCVSSARVNIVRRFPPSTARAPDATAFPVASDLADARVSLTRAPPRFPSQALQAARADMDRAREGARGRDLRDQGERPEEQGAGETPQRQRLPRHPLPPRRPDARVQRGAIRRAPRRVRPQGVARRQTRPLLSRPQQLVRTRRRTPLPRPGNRRGRLYLAQAHARARGREHTLPRAHGAGHLGRVVHRRGGRVRRPRGEGGERGSQTKSGGVGGGGIGGGGCGRWRVGRSPPPHRLLRRITTRTRSNIFFARRGGVR